MSRRGLTMGMLLVAAVVATGCTTHGQVSDSSGAVHEDESAYGERASEPEWTQPIVAWPSNGFGTVGDGSGEGCLSVSVPNGSEAYYIKLKQGYTTVWDVFMTPGATTEFSVPLGTYDMTYGAGEDWFGWQYAFGPAGAYSETAETFTFDANSCWQVELFLQVGGNLGTSGLDYSDF